MTPFQGPPFSPVWRQASIIERLASDMMDGGMWCLEAPGGGGFFNNKALRDPPARSTA